MKTLMISIIFTLLFTAVACDDGKTSTNNANNANNINNASNATCGNDVIEGAETCDGTDLNAQTCMTKGFSGGTLACASTCLSFITSACTNNTPVCGNGVIEGAEACDGSALDGQSCTSLGFVSGTLACSANCTFNTSACQGGGGDGVVGDACGDLNDCGGVVGQGLTAECMTSLGGFVTMPGGYCTSSCTVPANPGDPDACAAAGGVCMSALMASYCIQPCVDATECREDEGYTCGASPLGGDATYCLPPMGGK